MSKWVCVSVFVWVCGEYVQERRRKGKGWGLYLYKFLRVVMGVYVCVCVYTCLFLCVSLCVRVYAICDTYKQGIKNGPQISIWLWKSSQKKFVKQLIFMFLCFWSCLHAHNTKFINKCCCCCCCYTPFLAASCNTVATAHTLKNIESLLLIIIVASTTVYLQSLNCFSYTHIRIVFLYLFLVYFEWKSIWITILFSFLENARFFFSILTLIERSHA